MSDSLWPHGLQHTRLPCPSPSLGVCSNSCPLNRWFHPTISSSVAPSLPALNLSSIRVFSNESLNQVAKVLEFKLQHQSGQWISGLISFRVDWFDLLRERHKIWVWSLDLTPASYEMSWVNCLTWPVCFFPFSNSNYRYRPCSAHNHCKDTARTVQMLF